MEQSRRILAKARIDGPIDGLLTEVILIPEIIGKCFLDRKKKMFKTVRSLLHHDRNKITSIVNAADTNQRHFDSARVAV